MRPRLLISVLVLALSAVNSDGALMCVAYCESSASMRNAASHHHQMEPGTSGVRAHAHHRGTPCLECPGKSGSSLSQNPGCTSLLEIQAVKEGSFTLRANNGVHPVADDRLAVRLAPAFEEERSSFFGAASPPLKSSSSASLPLRI